MKVEGFQIVVNYIKELIVPSCLDSGCSTVEHYKSYLLELILMKKTGEPQPIQVTVLSTLLP